MSAVFTGTFTRPGYSHNAYTSVSESMINPDPGAMMWQRPMAATCLAGSLQSRAWRTSGWVGACIRAASRLVLWGQPVREHSRFGLDSVRDDVKLARTDATCRASCTFK